MTTSIHKRRLHLVLRGAARSGRRLMVAVHARGLGGCISERAALAFYPTQAVRSGRRLIIAVRR